MKRMNKVNGSVDTRFSIHVEGEGGNSKSDEKNDRKSSSVHSSYSTDGFTPLDQKCKPDLFSQSPLCQARRSRSDISGLARFESPVGHSLDIRTTADKGFKIPPKPQGGESPKLMASTTRKSRVRTSRDSGNKGASGTRSLVSNTPSQIKSNHHLNNLMEYLNHVDSDTASQDRIIERMNHSTQPSTRVTSRNIRGSLGNSVAKDVFGGIKSKIDLLKSKLREKDAECIRLRSELKKKENDFSDSIAKAGLAKTAAIKAQKLEFEAALERNLGLSDRLLKDKEDLALQCTHLVEKARIAEERYEKLLDQAREKHKMNVINKQKQWAAAEKARRDRWERERTAQIKEMTIRGLEPEIKSILKKAKSDLKDAEDRNANALKIQKQEHKVRLDEAVLKAKEQTNRELNETFRKREEDLNRQIQNFRGESMVRWREEKAKLDALLFEEREKMQQVLLSERASMGEERFAAQENLRVTLEAERKKHENDKQDMRKKLSQIHKTEISKLREEKEKWQKAVLIKLNNQAKQREKVMVLKLKKQQQKELEVVIKKLSDHQIVKEKATSVQVKQVAQKYRSLIEEKEKIAKDWMSKGLQAQKRVSGLEDEISSLRSKLSRERLAKEEIKRECSQIRQQLSTSENSSHVEEKNLQKRLADLSGELKTVKEQKRAIREEMAKASKKQVTEIREMRQQLEANNRQEIERLHVMVRKAVAKKDEVIKKLTGKLKELEARNKELERALDDV
ncbi:hypothetical protein AAMO2058_000308200 [Amorphochlora amoebiformis]